MMGVVKSTNVARLSILFFFILLSLSKSLLAQQEDFVSIQCCAPSSFIDPITKIRWTSDTHLQNNGKCENISNPKGNNNRLSRFFYNGSSGKWCYKLDTVNGQNYLVRGTFVRGNQTPDNTSFDVSLGATLVGRVSSSVEFLELEAIFGANNDNMDFCIVRRTGDPYLSKLELRLLGDSDYSERDPSSILKVVIRSDVGNTKGLIRYPFDLGDRIWNINVSQIENATPESNLNMGVTGANTTVPVPVLQTAVTNAERLEFFHNGLGVDDADYLIYLYFLELNATVGRGQRAFDIYVNGKVQPGIFDMLGHGNTSNYKEVVLKIKTNRFLNVSLIKVDGAEFGPMLNAYEIFEVQKRVEGTLQKDADIIVKLRDELLVENQGNEVLASWSGDPCLPISWHGLHCHSSDNGSMVITHLDLSSSGLQGPLPPVITELPHLTQLNLSLNQFQGTIPPFPLYSVLMSLDVSHNDLNGPIPESLASLPNLSKLYFGCNSHFGKVHHSKFLNRANLTTDSGICNSTPHSRTGRSVVIGSVAAGSLLFTVAGCAMFICIYRRRLLRKLNDEDFRVTQSEFTSTFEFR
ncbi:non-specific serine/threonine protein kinase [Ranunculus cassubicifolius]